MRLFRGWKSYIYLLLIDVKDSKVLLQSNRDNYSLPCIKLNQGLSFDDVASVKNAVNKDFGISTNVLYYASYEVDQNKHTVQAIYVLEQHPPGETIQIGTWFDVSSLAGVALDHPEHKTMIEQCLTELTTGQTPTLRPPWAKPGCLQQASNWVDAQLEDLGYSSITAIECVRNWSISWVLSIKTAEGTLYLKAASPNVPLFCDEPVVTQTLACLFLDQIPTVLAIHPQHHWMLLTDFGKPIGHRIPLRTKEHIYRSFANLQIQATQHCDRMLAAGCLDRRLHVLHTQIEPFINDEETLSALSAAEVEIEQLHAVAPKLKDLCSQLASYNIPETLVHGDLHLNNVAFHQEHYLYFDWTDACISHPFFDLLKFSLADKQISLLSDVTRLWQQRSMTRLRHEYLKQWQQYESPERLSAAWNIAKPLCILHHAITYQTMIKALEARTRPEVSHVLPYLLRELISMC
ncbi:aminoglycoside phosphotransferase family protein [Leptothoe sp. LEGE 181152]|nr:aminoglycoside phosphotransferase family protein [Leptothoe sp. LEGE 181152]